MRKIIFFALLLLGVDLQAQKEDYTWLSGFGSQYGYDTPSHQWYGISKFDFNQQPVAINPYPFSIDIDQANAPISDRNGNLSFITNGVKIYNSLNEKVQNGDSIGVGYVLKYLYPYGLTVGHPFPEGLMVLPNPIYQGVYDLFTAYEDTFNNSNADIGVKKMLRTTLDMNANSNHGKVLQKDKAFIEHETSGSIVAVRHGNGRDWWLCTYRTGSNCYDVMLYDGSDSIRHFNYCGGGQIIHGFIGSLRFSPDGTKFIMASDATGEISIFDFDRCAGILSLKEMFVIPEVVDSAWYSEGLEFSPNSRYAYIFCGAKIFQIDLNASSIANSRYTVASFTAAFGPGSPTYYYAQLAPDGKIYINSNSGNNYLSVITNPNGSGAGCLFKDTFQTPTFVTGLPHYPNYRLGVLNGSGCDTLTGINNMERSEKEKILKVFPNPSTDIVTIDYGFLDWSKGNVDLQIMNCLGQAVFQQCLPLYSGFQKVDVTAFDEGLYTVFIKRKNAVVASIRFVKQ